MSHTAKLIAGWQYSCRCVDRHNTSATDTTMKPGDPLNGKHQADRANSCPWSPTMRASGSMKTKTNAAAWHMERASRARYLQHEQCKQVGWQHQGHRLQTTRRAWAATTTATPNYFGVIPKIRGCFLFVLWPWPKKEKSSLFFRWYAQCQRCPSDLDSGLDVTLAQTIADVIIENQFLILIIDSLH